MFKINFKYQEIKPVKKGNTKTTKTEEEEILKKSLYLKERLKKAVQKVEKKKQTTIYNLYFIFY